MIQERDIFSSASQPGSLKSLLAVHTHVDVCATYNYWVRVIFAATELKFVSVLMTSSFSECHYIQRINSVEFPYWAISENGIAVHVYELDKNLVLRFTFCLGAHVAPPSH